MRVLIADDEPDSRLALAATTERLGHECVQAGDGTEALRLFAEHQPDVVIAKSHLPGVDGGELVGRIRSEPDVPYAYVMLLTSAGDEAAARTAIEAGADDLVTAPLEAAALERRLIAAERMTTVQRRLDRDARQDALTGVGNRLRLAEDLQALCGRVARYGHAYCVALLDIDHFKAVNDGAGRRAGDDVLRAVAQALSGTIRSGDTLYRYGGEEFLVLLPEQSLEGAGQAAERLRASVEAIGLPRPDRGTVTVSAGVAGLGDADCSPEQLFELADRALARAKEGGRNRVEVERAGDEDAERTSIRLLIAGDDEATRAALSALADREDGFRLVGAAAGADQVIEMAARRRPDVVLLDFDMAAGGGLRAAIDIRDAQPGVRVVALTADDSPAAQLDMSRAGAVGYLVKGAADDEIVRVIRSASRY